jgi:hypothetical protein
LFLRPALGFAHRFLERFWHLVGNAQLPEDAAQKLVKYPHSIQEKLASTKKEKGK